MGQERKKVKNGLRYDKNGWIYVSVKGTAKERGYANGFLLSAELKRVFHMADYNQPELSRILRRNGIYRSWRQRRRIR